MPSSYPEKVKNCLTVVEVVQRLKSVEHEQKKHRDVTTDKNKKSTKIQSVFVKEKKVNKVKPVETANNTDDNIMNDNTKMTQNEDKQITEMYESKCGLCYIK